LDELKRFFEAHRQKTSSAELSQYVSFALAVDQPPEFQFRFKEYLLPPDVQPLIGFDKLMARFHAEAGIDELWRAAQPDFDRAIARYHEPVALAVREVNGYLRNTSSGFVDRRFQIYVDLLGAPEQVASRSYADDYFIVVTPSAAPQIQHIRHGYLHYLLDPLTSKYGEDVNKKKSLQDFALGAAALEESYKSDFLLLVTESLIKSIEARLAPASKRTEMINVATAEGFILTPFFSEYLPAYEKQEQAMRLHFPDMIAAIDLKRESQRLDKVQFAQRKSTPAPEVSAAEAPPRLSGVEKQFEEAERLYTARELERAREAYLKVLQGNDNRPLHAKAYYGLARIAALNKDPELSEKLFQRALELSADPQITAWSYVYLGRLADAAGDREGAARNYEAALRVEGASAAARTAAEQGLSKEFKRNQ
jgi:tetratricopeptide (TPR) repeat protein